MEGFIKITRKVLFSTIISTILGFSFLNGASFKLPKLQVGDLVFRLGKGSQSRIIAYVSDFKYSHLGYVSSLNPPFIIHATTDDNKVKNNQVIQSSLKNFLLHADKFAIVRINFLNKEEKIKIAKALKKRLGEPFLLLSKKHKNLYCTTLLEQEFNKIKTFNPPYKYVDIALLKGYYLFPKAFYELNDTKVIFSNP